MAAEKVSQIERGRPATLVLGYVLAVFRPLLSEAVLVLDRSSNCIIPSWLTRCSGSNLVMDRLMERETAVCGP